MRFVHDTRAEEEPGCVACVPLNMRDPAHSSALQPASTLHCGIMSFLHVQKRVSYLTFLQNDASARSTESVSSYCLFCLHLHCSSSRE